MSAGTAEALAQRFHETYERLAPEYGYETRAMSAVPWDAVPERNKRLMIAVCEELGQQRPASAATEQPMPTPNDGESIQAMVRADLVEREKLGVERYGTPLQAHNGRNALRDAYEEALDLACYLRQALVESYGGSA